MTLRKDVASWSIAVALVLGQGQPARGGDAEISLKGTRTAVLLRTAGAKPERAVSDRFDAANMAKINIFSHRSPVQGSVDWIRVGTRRRASGGHTVDAWMHVRRRACSVEHHLLGLRPALREGSGYSFTLREIPSQLASLVLRGPRISDAALAGHRMRALVETTDGVAKIEVDLKGAKAQRKPLERFLHRFLADVGGQRRPISAQKLNHALRKAGFEPDIIEVALIKRGGDSGALPLRLAELRRYRAVADQMVPATAERLPAFSRDVVARVGPTFAAALDGQLRRRIGASGQVFAVECDNLILGSPDYTIAGSGRGPTWASGKIYVK